MFCADKDLFSHLEKFKKYCRTNDARLIEVPLVLAKKAIEYRKNNNLVCENVEDGNKNVGAKLNGELDKLHEDAQNMLVRGLNEHSKAKKERCKLVDQVIKQCSK